MRLHEKDIEFIMDKVQPKITSYLYQTHPNYREDLEQELKEMIVQKVKEQPLDYEVPGFFEYLAQKSRQ